MAMLSPAQLRQLQADWFVVFAHKEGLSLANKSASGDAFVLGDQRGPHVVASFVKEVPFLRFAAQNGADERTVEAVARESAKRSMVEDTGGDVWYSTVLAESPQLFHHVLLRLGSQARIQGWRRLGGYALLHFEEPDAAGQSPDSPFAPKALVKVHLSAPGPCQGFFSDAVAMTALEVVAATAGFALGRPLIMPPTIFSTKAEELNEVAQRASDPNIGTLTRRGVSLDLARDLRLLGGMDSVVRARAALLTIDAALHQERHNVASILYVVAAEALTVPDRPWRKRRLAKRFIEFFDALMPEDLDAIVRHHNFEEAFGVTRGNKQPRTLRRELLDNIYDLRSGLVHEGLGPTPGVMFGADTETLVRRGLLFDFVEAAVLRFISSPRSSLIGHPSLDAASSSCEAAADCP